MINCKKNMFIILFMSVIYYSYLKMPIADFLTLFEFLVFISLFFLLVELFGENDVSIKLCFLINDFLNRKGRIL